jgi:hypothetical protein
MTNITHRPRRDPIATHIYSLPVVREFPTQPPVAVGNATW